MTPTAERGPGAGRELTAGREPGVRHQSGAGPINREGA